MHARVSKLEGPPEQVNELGRIAAEWVAPSLTEMEGFRGIWYCPAFADGFPLSHSRSLHSSLLVLQRAHLS